MRLIQTACCIALTLPLFAYAAPAHVHGVAKIDLAVDGNKLTLSMEMPLENLAGFEHLPKTDKQKAALAEAMKSLKNGARSLSDLTKSAAKSGKAAHFRPCSCANRTTIRLKPGQNCSRLPHF